MNTFFCSSKGIVLPKFLIVTELYIKLDEHSISTIELSFECSKAFLIKNALEHSKDNSIVEIECSSNLIYNSVTIRNFGSTIPLEEQKNVFKRFYKGSNSNGESVGIGLSLAKSIVEKDGGTISINSSDDITEFIIKYYKD